MLSARIVPVEPRDEDSSPPRWRGPGCQEFPTVLVDEPEKNNAGPAPLVVIVLWVTVLKADPPAKWTG